MIQNKDYRFPVSISKETFVDKIISGAMIGSNTSENKEIRKQYGYKGSDTIHYQKTYVTSEELLDYLLNGHVICHIFASDLFTKSFKNNSNFKCAYMIGVDIDDTQYTVEEFIDKLSFKPTFFYTSYSNMKNGNGARFRLVYVVNTRQSGPPIKNPYLFRYCVYCLNTIIERDTNEVIKDKCNQNCSQYFNGTNKDNEDIILEHGITNYVYELEDFGINAEGFKDFLINYCYYKTANKEHTRGMLDLLNRIFKIKCIYDSSIMMFVETPDNDSECQTTGIIPQEKTKCSNWFVNLLKRKGFEGYETVLKLYRHKFPYIYRKEKDEWIDNLYQFVDNDYFSLYYNYNIVKDGNQRRKKLYERMCLRRILYPNADADTLLFNAFIDVCRFFEVDNDLTIECLVRNVESVMSMSIEDIQNNFKQAIEELQETRRPKCGIILKRGVCFGAVETNKKLREIRWNIIAESYKTNSSLQENLIFINDCLGISVSRSTLYRFCKERNYRTSIDTKNRLTDEELLELIDTNLSERKNMKFLKDNDICVGNKRMRKLLKQKRDNECSRCLNTQGKTNVDDGAVVVSMHKETLERTECDCHTNSDCLCERGKGVKKDYNFDGIFEIANRIVSDPSYYKQIKECV